MTDTPTPTLYRLVPAELARPDARTLTGTAVRYDTPTDVVDLLPDGTADVYREGFRSSAFVNSFAQPQRVRLVDGHQIDGSQGPDIGIAVAMRSEADALVVDFRLFPETAGKVEMLLDEGVQGLSVGFAPARGGTELDAAGVRWRTRAMLRHVALVPQGAYPGAEVTALRDGPDDLAIAEAEYAARVAELDDFLARIQAEQDEWRTRIAPPADADA
jgi:HK97 family phage prohead protease